MDGAITLSGGMSSIGMEQLSSMMLLMAQDKRIGRSHLEIFHKGYRGFGGKCLPKDTQSLVQFADENEVNMSLLKEVENINNNLKNGTS